MSADNLLDKPVCKAYMKACFGLTQELQYPDVHSMIISGTMSVLDMYEDEIKLMKIHVDLLTKLIEDREKTNAQRG